MDSNIKKKPVFSTELAYFIAMITLALGTAFMEAADFGMSMVVAPAYILHLKISEFLPFFSFGMAEYLLQGVLLVLLSVILRHFKISYLFSFVTAVLYGFCLDGCMAVVGFFPADGLIFRVIYYIIGMIICSVGVALFFRTYFCPEAYELIVAEISKKYSLPVPRVKTVYDCVSCAVSIVLSFAFFGFGRFEGVKWGTIVCALVNGSIIGLCSKALDASFEWKDCLPLKKYFQK
ncbi:MAG: hypothetical protein IKI93_04820 [Clostridia bacterium]|nr:hypothetical protein [Clostridia bacterium]